jgi:hypothetical protein
MKCTAYAVKLACGDNAFFDKGVIIGFAFEIIPSLTVAHAAHRRYADSDYVQTALALARQHFQE